MTSESHQQDQASLEQLLSDLTDAKLEKRDADIDRLQKEIGKRQANGEPAPQPPDQETARKTF